MWLRAMALSRSRSMPGLGSATAPRGTGAATLLGGGGSLRGAAAATGPSGRKSPTFLAAEMMVGPKPTMRQMVEKRVEKSRFAEVKANDLNSMLKEHVVLAGHGRSDARVDYLRRQRCREQEEQELFTDHMFIKTQQDNERNKIMSQMEQTLAEELERKRAADVRTEQHRRRVCEGSEELRQLKGKLHAAVTNKVRAAQLLEHQSRLEEEKDRDTAICQQLEHERLEHGELERKLELEKARTRTRVMQVNQEQIAQREANRTEAFEQYSREKREVQELVERIEHEDQMEKAALRAKQEDMIRDIKAFEKEQQAQRSEMERKEREENEKIEEFARQKREFEEQVQREKDEMEAEKRRILNAMIGIAEAKSHEAEEREQLLNDLRGEEHEAEGRRREELKMRKKLEDRVEMLQAYEAAQQYKEEKRQLEIQEEERFRAELLAKFAEDDRLEQMSAQKRRMRIEDHKREVERQIALRREHYEIERKEERDLAERLRQEEKDRLGIIEDERRRLLEEHATGLRDFLPKGTLEKQEDFHLIGL